MPNVDPNDLVWIQDAAEEFGRSREWLDKQLKGRLLSVVKKPGDTKVYLLRSELQKILAPYVKRSRQEDAG
jgi:hypothetical protein